jgi:hypothetical protein
MVKSSKLRLELLVPCGSGRKDLPNEWIPANCVMGLKSGLAKQKQSNMPIGRIFANGEE